MIRLKAAIHLILKLMPQVTTTAEPKCSAPSKLTSEMRRRLCVLIGLGLNSKCYLSTRIQPMMIIIALMIRL